MSDFGVRVWLRGLALLLVSALLPLRAADWPQWRGPERDGVSLDTGLLDSWPDGGPPLVWTVYVGGGYSSLAVSDGRLYTMGNRAGSEFLIAWDIESGRELWVRRTGPAYRNDKGSGPRSTPTVDGDRVYALGANGDLWCVSAGGGDPQWHVNLLETFGGDNITWGISESPLVDRDRVIVAAGGTSGSIVALGKSDARLVWQTAEVRDAPSYASAVVAEVGGVRQIVHFLSGGAVGIRAEDGKLLWRYDRTANDQANCTTPVFDDGRVFLTSGYDTGAALLRLDSSGSKTTATEVYFTRDMINHHGGVVILDGHVYGFSNNSLTCLDLMTGERRWRERGVGKGSVAVADGMLYTVSQHGIVGLVRPDPRAYQEVSRFTVDVGRRKLWAHPVIAGGRLYVRGANRIWSFDLRATN